MTFRSIKSKKVNKKNLIEKCVLVVVKKADGFVYFKSTFLTNVRSVRLVPPIKSASSYFVTFLPTNMS